MNPLSMLEMMVSAVETDPTLEQMPSRSLVDKGINGPTSAHVIEQIHTPLNLAYVTFTTGSSAFQNIVGITWSELPDRVSAGCKVLELAGIQSGDKLLVTYPPLVNVFGVNAFKNIGIEHHFLLRSNRDAFLLALCQHPYNVVLGESSFFRATLEQAIKLGLTSYLPKSLIMLAAGTPLDLDLLPLAEKFGYQLFDLYGNQEFGWLTINGIAVRDDLSFVPSLALDGYVEVVVGGLPTGDSFPTSTEQGHLLNRQRIAPQSSPNLGTLLTYKRIRSTPEYEVVVTATQCQTQELAERAARTILRIKGRVVKVSHNIKLNADATELQLLPSLPINEIQNPIAPIVIRGEQKTRLFDSLLEAQRIFQSQSKSDSTWLKRR